jgi:hypothetical protein
LALGSTTWIHNSFSLFIYFLYLEIYESFSLRQWGEITL